MMVYGIHFVKNVAGCGQFNFVKSLNVINERTESIFFLTNLSGKQSVAQWRELRENILFLSFPFN